MLAMNARTGHDGFSTKNFLKVFTRNGQKAANKGGASRKFSPDRTKRHGASSVLAARESREQKQELKHIVAGPDQVRDGVVRSHLSEI